MIEELKSLGKELSGAMYVAKRFRLRKCNHEGKIKSATDCILSLIGQSLQLYSTCKSYMYSYSYLLYLGLLPYMYVNYNCIMLHIILSYHAQRHIDSLYYKSTIYFVVGNMAYECATNVYYLMIVNSASRLLKLISILLFFRR